MKVLITGAHGKVGRAATQAMIDAGHEVMTTDLTRANFDRKPEGAPKYTTADLTDAGEPEEMPNPNDFFYRGRDLLSL